MPKHIPITKLDDTPVSRCIIIDVSDIIRIIDDAFKSIDFFEYDLDEIFTLLLTQLRWSKHFPNSYTTFVVGVDLDDTFRRVYSLMYRKLVSNGCYGSDGELRWVGFELMVDNAIAIKLIEIE